MSGKFWERPLEQLSRSEWEQLCDGCGKCCLHKLEDAETGEVFPTNIACKLLDRLTCQCSNYRMRKMFVPDCVRLTNAKIERFAWLPSTCAYRLRAEGQPLPEWHHLNSGSRETVHEAGVSVRGWTISENDAGDIENHVIEREL